MCGKCPFLLVVGTTEGGGKPPTNGSGSPSVAENGGKPLTTAGGNGSDNAAVDDMLLPSVNMAFLSKKCEFICTADDDDDDDGKGEGDGAARCLSWEERVRAVEFDRRRFAARPLVPLLLG